MVKKLLLWASLFLPVFATAQTNDWYRRVAFGEALYRSGQYIEAAREFRLAKEGLVYGYTADNELVMFLMARASYMAGERNAISELANYCRTFPFGVHYAEASILLADSYLRSNGDYKYFAAWFVLDDIDERMISDDKRDEMRIKLGYSHLQNVLIFMNNKSLGEGSNALNPWEPALLKIDSTNSYYSDAQYIMGYNSYIMGHYNDARRYYQQAAGAEQFRATIPYYMMQVDFAQERWRAVVDNAAQALQLTDNEKVTDVRRMVGVSMYRLKNWSGSVAMLIRYMSDNNGFLTQPEMYMLGTANYMTGNYKLAELYLQQIEGDDSLVQNANYLLGDIYIKQDKKLLAIEAFSKAATVSYNADIKQDALFNLCKLHYESDENSGSKNVLELLNKYLQNYPNSSNSDEIRSYLVTIYYNSHNFEAAIKTVQEIKNYNNVIRLAMQKITYSRAVELFNSGDLDGAMALLEQSKSQNKDVKYSALADFWMGEILYRRGNYIDAIARYNAYLRVAPSTEPEVVEAKYNIAYAYFNQKKWAEARVNFDAFLTQYKGNDSFAADALNRRGDIEYAQTNYRKAIEFYTKATGYKVDARYYAAFQRAMMFGLIDQDGQKIESLKDIIHSKSGGYIDVATYELADTYRYLGRYGDVVRMLENFSTDFPASPYLAQSALYQGIAYRSLNDSDRALECFRQVFARERDTETAADALDGVQHIFIEREDLEGYRKYMQSAGIESVNADIASVAAAIEERQKFAATKAKREE